MWAGKPKIAAPWISRDKAERMSGAEQTGPLLTQDGVPLKVSLRRSQQRIKMRAFLLVVPLLVFIMISFVVPIASLFTRSVDDMLVNEVLPLTFEEFKNWDGQSVPDEALYAAMFMDLKNADKIEVGRVSTRMNYEKSGWKSLLKKTTRTMKKIKEPPYKEQMIKINKRWGDIEFWQSLSAMKDPYTLGYYLNALDLKYGYGKTIEQQPENRQVYNLLWKRTLLVSLLVTIFCLVLGYPVAHLLATLPITKSNLLMICVLIPFWTSLLVRIVSWMVMLQQEGVVNDTLVALGLPEELRLPMMYNFTGTLIVMTQILLPFMILPIFSVMKTIPPSYMRAAQNLGATPTLAFIRVYLPQTLPGVGAGSILVFIVAIGYYITPELVGGKDGRLIGNFIAFHMQNTLNWGLAAAMGVILLIGILILYWLYDKIVGIDNMKMG
jgi:putative spermidine/putrescine transport system permease protein